MKLNELRPGSRVLMWDRCKYYDMTVMEISPSGNFVYVEYAPCITKWIKVEDFKDEIIEILGFREFLVEAEEVDDEV